MNTESANNNGWRAEVCRVDYHLISTHRWFRSRRPLISFPTTISSITVDHRNGQDRGERIRLRTELRKYDSDYGIDVIGAGYKTVEFLAVLRFCLSRSDVVECRHIDQEVRVWRIFRGHVTTPR